MFHNSLPKHELLKRIGANPHVRTRREVHRNVGPRSGVKAGAGEVLLDGKWTMTTARKHPAEVEVAADAGDFLRRMGVTVEQSAERAVLLEVGSAERGFRVVVDEKRVEVHGADASSLWAGWVHLEGHMREKGAAVLPRGEVSREPAWGVHIGFPAWGANYAVPDLSEEFVGDDVYRVMAHDGCDGMIVYGDFLLYAQGTNVQELDHPDAAKHLAVLRAASERAARFGVKLFFCPVSPKLPVDHPAFAKHPDLRGAKLAHQEGAPVIHCLCSSSERALAWHAAVFRNLFAQVPQLGGLICIVGGESYYHCFMRAEGAGIGRTNCPRCDGKRAEDVIANFMKATADAVHASAPAAKVTAWPYSAHAFWSADPYNLPFIDRLPEGVALQSERDKDHVMRKEVGDGRFYSKATWDYSVDFVGPSDRIVAQAQRCALRGRELFVKTETSHGIELLHLPYSPSLTRSGRQWQAVRSLRPAGVLGRWGFIGMFNSAAERVATKARWNPMFSPESDCLAVARELVGAELAPRVVEAWRHFDVAVGHIPVLTTGAYYKGPLFLGPACPLPTWDGPTPDVFTGNFYYLAEAEATFSTARLAVKDDFVVHSTRELHGAPVDVIEREFYTGADAARRGYELLAKIDATALPSGSRAELEEQLALGECLYRTLRTAGNTVRFLRAKEAGNREGMKAAAADELENAEAALLLYRRAPWLNHRIRLDVLAPETVAAIEEKVKLLKAFTAA